MLSQSIAPKLTLKLLLIILMDFYVQRECMRAVEEGEEADSPDKEHVPSTAVGGLRYETAKRKLLMDSGVHQLSLHGADGQGDKVFKRKRKKTKESVEVKSPSSISKAERAARLKSNILQFYENGKSPERDEKTKEEDVQANNDRHLVCRKLDLQQPAPRRRGRPKKAVRTVQECDKDIQIDADGKGEILVGNTDAQVAPSPSNCNDGGVSTAEPGSSSKKEKFSSICKWLTKSLSHPLSEEAGHAEIRPSLQHAVDTIYDNVRTTIEQSFNNSVLVVGAPGSGKSLAVSRICTLIKNTWNTIKVDPRVGIVRLSGLAFSDERAAFREIARQLCDQLHLEFVKQASYGENIQFLLAILKALAEANKAAVFILDDFDLFAHNQKQIFLYCLLDSLQKSNAKAVVIGTTSRYDCLDLLEKRVKSRFSHRTVILNPPVQTTLDMENATGDGADSVLKSMLCMPVDVYPDSEAAMEHNSRVHAALENKSVIDSLSKVIQESNSLHRLCSIAKKTLVYCYRSGSFCFEEKHLLKAIQSTKLTRGFESMIATLCPLDLALLAATYKVRSCRKDDLLNFEMIHHEFRSFATSGSHVDNYSKAAALKSFEHLQSLGLVQVLRDRSGPLSRRDRTFTPVALQVTRHEMIEGLKANEYCPNRLAEWCMKDGAPGTTALAFY
jgi:origin recognition complex subunit 4